MVIRFTLVAALLATLTLGACSASDDEIGVAVGKTHQEATASHPERWVIRFRVREDDGTMVDKYFTTTKEKYDSVLVMDNLVGELTGPLVFMEKSRVFTSLE